MMRACAATCFSDNILPSCLFCVPARFSQGFEEGDERFLIGGGEMNAAVRMLGDVGIEGVGAVDARTVVRHDSSESGKTAIVHVRPGQFDIAQTGRLEFIPVSRAACDLKTSPIACIGFEPVVLELVVCKEIAAVTVKAIRPPNSPRRVILGNKEFQTAFFLIGELRFAPQSAVELRIG